MQQTYDLLLFFNCDYGSFPSSGAWSLKIMQAQIALFSTASLSAFDFSTCNSSFYLWGKIWSLHVRNEVSRCVWWFDKHFTNTDINKKFSFPRSNDLLVFTERFVCWNWLTGYQTQKPHRSSLAPLLLHNSFHLCHLSSW